MQASRAKATRVYGDSRAAWYLSGQYYDSEWNPISHEEAALPALDSERTPEPEPEVETVPTYTVHKAAPKEVIPEIAGLDEFKVQRPTEVDATFGSDRFLRLKVCKPLQLQRMVMKAGGTPATGHGAKKKNIDWLLEHLED